MPPAVWPLVERLLARHLPARDLAPVLGDLCEDYAHHLATRGRLRAEWWLLGEALSLSSAYRTARRRLRQSHRTPIDMLRSDLVHAWRALGARPAATLATIAVLALGIGLVSAMFGLADPYLLRPLPYARAAELYDINIRTASPAHVPTLFDLASRTELFAGVLAQDTSEPVAVAATTIDGPETTLRLAAVSRGYFDLLGIPMVMPDDWRSAGNFETPVILTAAAAARLPGANARGHLLRRIDGPGVLRVAATMTGPFVDPFGRPGATLDGVIPLDDGPLLSIETIGGGYRSSGPRVLARLRPGVTPQIVEGALSTVPADTRSPIPWDGLVVTTQSLVERLTARVRPLALGALAAGLLILVVCAANVANLLLVRGAARTREFAAREAMGASRGAIARLVLVELALLTMGGVVVGIGLAKAALVAATLVIPAEYTTLGSPAITARVVGLAVAAGALVMLAGMVPGWAAWRVTPLALFHRIAPGENVRIRVLRFTMTAAQAAIAVVLLVGAMLFGRSYVNLVTQDPGYDGDTLAVTAVYDRETAVNANVHETIARLRTIPGVTQVGASPGPMVDGLIMGGVSSMTINGERVRVRPRQATLDFFAAIGSRLVDGRLWRADDGGPTSVVTESFAAVCCGGSSPVGQTLVAGDRTFEIVGVVKDLFTAAFDQKPGPGVFIPLDAGSGTGSGWVNYVIRTNASDAVLAMAAEREVKAANANVTIRGSASMRERLMQSINDRSFATLIVVFFGLAAIGVSAAGVVGVVGFIVARRTREIAIRLSIGATTGDVRRLVTREAGVAAAMGAAAGLVIARWLSTTVEGLLYGVAPADPWAFVLAACAIVATVVSAAWLPARRASRLSPSIALRAE